MKPARAPRSNRAQIRLLVVKQDRQDGQDPQDRIRHSRIDDLPDHLQAGDLLVVNDAATLPASLHGQDARGNQLEIRLASQIDKRVWQAVILGAGNWRTATERRLPPPLLKEGDEIRLAEDFRARVLGVHDLSRRLLSLEFNMEARDLWSCLYRYGRPVQYSYMNNELALWSVQNVYASRPWAIEMPSAGHALNWQLMLRLMKRGVQIVTLTHAAGLSSTGDNTIDRALPLAERFEIPPNTIDAISRTKARGGRVIAVGTSVVRALESASSGLSGFTDLRLDSGYQPRIVGGLLTGTHEASESHYQLLKAFLPSETLTRVNRSLEEGNYLTHEFGDLCLILAPLSTRIATRSLFAQAEV